MQPLVSVILAVKNENARLLLAVKDLLGQSHKNLEIILSDDASTDPGTRQAIDSITDERVIKVFHKEHQGLSRIKNHAISICTAEFIAIADADDRYQKDRIKKQLRFLEENPGISFCGSNISMSNGAPPWEIYTGHNQIMAQFILNNPFVHPSVMFRRSLLDQGYEYHPEFDYAEDYDLFSSFRHRIHMANLPEKLVVYNVAPKEGVLKTLSADQKEKSAKVRKRILEEEFRELPEGFISTHEKISNLDPGMKYPGLSKWKKTLVNAYKHSGLLTLDQVLSTQILRYVLKYNVEVPRIAMQKLIRKSLLPSGKKFKMGVKFLLKRN